MFNVNVVYLEYVGIISFEAAFTYKRRFCPSAKSSFSHLKIIF